MSLFTKQFIKVPHLTFLSSFKEIGRNAFVDWLFILIVNTIIAICLIIGGYYLYWQISSGNFKSQEVVQKTDENIFDQKGLQDVTDLFRGREDMSRQAKMGYRGPADPSL